MPATSPSAGVFFDQVLDRAAAPLRRDHQRAVLDEGARVAEVVDVLARGALTGLAPARDRLGPCGIEPVRMALVHLGQIGADVIEIDLLRPRLPRLLDLRPLR